MAYGDASKRYKCRRSSNQSYVHICVHQELEVQHKKKRDCNKYCFQTFNKLLTKIAKNQWYCHILHSVYSMEFQETLWHNTEVNLASRALETATAFASRLHAPISLLTFERPVVYPVLTDGKWYIICSHWSDAKGRVLYILITIDGNFCSQQASANISMEVEQGSSATNYTVNGKWIYQCKRDQMDYNSVVPLHASQWSRIQREKHFSFMNTSHEAVVYCNTWTSWDFNIFFFLSIIAISNQNRVQQNWKWSVFVGYQTRHK